MANQWKRVDAARFWEMLEILPPAEHLGHGFLVGEPWTHRTCRETGHFRPAYAAFVEHRQESGVNEYYESTEPMTRPEFRALKREDVLDHISAVAA